MKQEREATMVSFGSSKVGRRTMRRHESKWRPCCVFVVMGSRSTALHRAGQSNRNPCTLDYDDKLRSSIQ